jgi:CheY-like chemotaxis protein
MSPQTILIVDDNPANIPHVVDYLEFHGFVTHVASNGEEGVARAQELRPDVTLMDVQMPGMSGLDAMRLLRSDPGTADLKIIAITALATPDDQRSCTDAGASEYLAKPFRLKELVAMIRRLLSD